MPGGVWRTTPGDGRNESGLQLHSVGPVVPQNCVTDHGGGTTHGPEYRALCRVHLSARITACWRADVEQVPPTTDAKSPGKKTTPTDRLSGFGTGLATNSDSGERVPRGHHSQYSTPNGSARASFFRSLATQEPSGGRSRHSIDVVNEPGRGCSLAFRSRLPPPSARVLTYSAHRPIEAYGGDSGPLPSPLHL